MWPFQMCCTSNAIPLESHSKWEPGSVPAQHTIGLSILWTGWQRGSEEDPFQMKFVGEIKHNPRWGASKLRVLFWEEVGIEAQMSLFFATHIHKKSWLDSDLNLRQNSKHNHLLGRQEGIIRGVGCFERGLRQSDLKASPILQFSALGLRQSCIIMKPPPLHPRCAPRGRQILVSKNHLGFGKISAWGNCVLWYWGFRGFFR